MRVPDVRLSGPRVTIRPLRRADLDVMSTWSPFDDPLYRLFDWPQRAYVENGAWFAQLMHDETRVYYAVENEENVLIGRISLRQIRGRESARLGIGFGNDFVSQGYGTESPRVFLRYFFLDLGFRNSLVENFNGLDKRPEAGAIVENAVFIKLNELCRGVDRVNFWRTKAGAEVDFVVRAGDEIIPVEVKYSEFSREKVSRSLMSFIDSFRPRRALVLTRDYWGMARRGGTAILFAPVYCL